MREAFRHRIEGMPEGVVALAATELGTTPADAAAVSPPLFALASRCVITTKPGVGWQMYKAVLYLVRKALYDSLAPQEVRGHNWKKAIAVERN